MPFSKAPVNLFQSLQPNAPDSTSSDAHWVTGSGVRITPQLRGSRSYRWGSHLTQSLFCGLALALGLGIASPGQAAERLVVRFGPLQQSVAIADLEEFAHTGEVSSTLKPYSTLLTSDVRLALESRLQLDPNVSDKLVEDLLQSSAGERLLNTLQVAIPDSTTEQLHTALTKAAQQMDGLSLLGFLRAFPGEALTVDGTSAIALASQMNLPYWQSQALSSLLEQELTVQTTKPLITHFDPSDPGPEWVQQETLTFRDYQRNRTIPVDLYWSYHTHGPLVILSHGFGADRRFLSYLAYHLASYGLTVAALEHPGSNVAWLTEITADASRTGKLGDILPATEFIDRPKDISFLLDRLERLNRYSTILRDKLNTKQVTVIGHSLGGYTALALAGAELNLDQVKQYCNSLGSVGLSPADWLQCTAAELPKGRVSLRDQRVGQAIALNPVTGHLFNEASLSRIKIPTLILAGTDDIITPAVSQQLLPFAQLKTSKYLLTAIGGSHLSVGDPANLNYALTESLFVRERRGEETAPLRQLLQGVSLAFIEQLTPEAARYTPFLTPAYAQSFSTPTLQLRLNSELPANLFNWLRVAALPLEQLVSSSLSKQQQNHQRGNVLHRDSLFNRLPLVMFILPGSLPLAGSQLLKSCRSRKNCKNPKAL